MRMTLPVAYQQEDGGLRAAETEHDGRAAQVLHIYRGKPEGSDDGPWRYQHQKHGAHDDGFAVATVPVTDRNGLFH